MFQALPVVPPSPVSHVSQLITVINSPTAADRPDVILDGVKIPRLPLETLRWMLSADEDDPETTLDPELAKAPVYLGANELATFILERDLLERIERAADHAGLTTDELVSELLRKAVS